MNVSDPALPQCGPDRIDRVTVENVQPDTDARHDFNFQSLEDAVNTLLPVTSGQTDLCSGAVGIELVLPVQIGKRRAKFKTTKKRLRTHARGRVDDSHRLRLPPASSGSTRGTRATASCSTSCAGSSLPTRGRACRGA